jgi:hypothetical protein
MGEWDDIGGASISQSGPKFNPHHNYLVEVVAVKDQKSFHGEFFIVETVVHESDDPDLLPDSRPSWSANKKHPQTKGRVLCFVGALMGIDPTNEAELRARVNGSHVGMLIGQQQVGKGRFIRVHTSEKDTQSGRDFTLHSFSPYSGPPLPSRLNNPPVAAGNSQAQAAAAAAPPPVSMPGAFVPPGAAPAGPPAFPSNGLPPPMQAPPPVQQTQWGPPPVAQSAPPAIPAPAVNPQWSPPPVAQQAPPAAQWGPPPVAQQAPPPWAPPAGAPPPLPQVQQTWPPAGWIPHTGDARYFWKPTSPATPPKTEPELRALQQAGQA